MGRSPATVQFNPSTLVATKRVAKYNETYIFPLCATVVHVPDGIGPMVDVSVVYDLEIAPTADEFEAYATVVNTLESVARRYHVLLVILVVAVHVSPSVLSSMIVLPAHAANVFPIVIRSLHVVLYVIYPCSQLNPSGLTNVILDDIEITQNTDPFQAILWYEELNGNVLPVHVNPSELMAY